MSSRLPRRLQSAWDFWLSRKVGLPALWDGLQASQPAARQETPDCSLRVWRPSGSRICTFRSGLVMSSCFLCWHSVSLNLVWTEKKQHLGQHQWVCMCMSVFRCSWLTTPSRGWSISVWTRWRLWATLSLSLMGGVPVRGALSLKEHWKTKWWWRNLMIKALQLERLICFHYWMSSKRWITATLNKTQTYFCLSRAR